MSPGEEPVQRTEYEQFVRTYEVRHTEMRLDMKEMENDMKAQLNAVINKMDALSNQVTRRSFDLWKMVASSSVSLIIGYIVSTLQHQFLR